MRPAGIKYNIGVSLSDDSIPFKRIREGIETQRNFERASNKPLETPQKGLQESLGHFSTCLAMNLDI